MAYSITEDFAAPARPDRPVTTAFCVIDRSVVRPRSAPRRSAHRGYELTLHPMAGAVYAR